MLATVREVAESDTPWTAEDVRFLWDTADSLILANHTAYQELYRIPLAAIQRLDHSERRAVLGTRQRWLKSSRRHAWDALHEQFDQVLTEPVSHGPAGLVRNVVWEGDPVARAMAGVRGSTRCLFWPASRRRCARSRCWPTWCARSTRWPRRRGWPVPLRSAPQAIRRDPALAEARATLKELPAERSRLERALIEERVWTWREVTELFLDHPVTGLYARNLIWQIPQGPPGCRS